MFADRPITLALALGRRNMGEQNKVPARCSKEQVVQFSVDKKSQFTEWQQWRFNVGG